MNETSSGKVRKLDEDPTSSIELSDEAVQEKKDIMERRKRRSKRQRRADGTFYSDESSGIE